MKLPPNATDEELAEWNARQIFVRDASPERWIEYSGELQSAAASLWELRENSMEVTVLHDGSGSDTISRALSNPRAYVLLAGFALETSLKAQLIVEQPRFITDAKLHKPIRTHGLLGLMDKLKNIAFSEDERLIASICESAIPYWGRYPVPLDFTQVEQEKRIHDDFHDGFVALNFKIRKIVYDAIKDGWDSGVGPKLGKLRSVEFGDEIDLKEPLLWCAEDESDVDQNAS